MVRWSGQFRLCANQTAIPGCCSSHAANAHHTSSLVDQQQWANHTYKHQRCISNPTDGFEQWRGHIDITAKYRSSTDLTRPAVLSGSRWQSATLANVTASVAVSNRWPGHRFAMALVISLVNTDQLANRFSESLGSRLSAQSNHRISDTSMSQTIAIQSTGV
jgi:hypothetical protein